MPRFLPEPSGHLGRRPRVMVAVFAVACLHVPALLHAQQGDTSAREGLTLRDAVDSALRNNPDLLIAHSTADSARSEVRIARALPNPTFSVIPGSPTQYAGTMPIDIGPQRVFRVAASTLGAHAVQSDVQDDARRVVLAVRKAFYDVLFADARLSIVEERRTVVQQLVAADSARVRAGDLPRRALVRSEVELVRTEADAARSAIDAQTTRLALQSLMGVVAPDTALLVVGDLGYRDVDIDDRSAIQTALASRPDVSASREREDQNAALTHLAVASVLPIPLVSYVRQFSAPFMSGRYGAIGVGFEVPLLSQYRGQYERAEAGSVAAHVARRRVELQVTSDVRSALANFHAQHALVRRYEGGVLDQVKQNVEATRYAYVRGATSLLELLDALRAQQDVLTDYNLALHDYWVALYTVEAAEGVGPH